MAVRRVNVRLEKVDPTGVYRAIFLQYIEEVGGRELPNTALGALRLKYGLNPVQFRAQEWNYLEEKRKQREEEREQRRHSRNGRNPTSDLGDPYGVGDSGRARTRNVGADRDRGENF